MKNISKKALLAKMNGRLVRRNYVNMEMASDIPELREYIRGLCKARKFSECVTEEAVRSLRVGGAIFNRPTLIQGEIGILEVRSRDYKLVVKGKSPKDSRYIAIETGKYFQILEDGNGFRATIPYATIEPEEPKFDRNQWIVYTLMD
jgi:hypothetical protein